MRRILLVQLLASLVHAQSASELIEILKGSGPAALEYANQSIPVDLVYSNFDSCANQCTTRPCSRHVLFEGGNNGECVEELEFTDSTGQLSSTTTFAYCTSNVLWI